MEELYPEGQGYHQAHEAYIRAVADLLPFAGFHVDDWSAEPNDPRDGFIGLHVAINGEARDAGPIWENDEVNLAWSEDRGWALVSVAQSHTNDGRFVYDLPVARVASPASVELAAAMQIGEECHPVADAHPDVDFPDHTFEDDDPAFEAALAHYRAPA
ncbi:DUF6292 family protein [Actinoplanes sp. URMC 104]|uniref:DUF6292 family protein n=1 Tax=Actinoplanes sp. URMC 104 TaxID=3423409 RepID=UPI003F19DCB5